MGFNINRAEVLGNLGADPEVRHLDGGGSLANLRIATNRKFKDRDGNLQEETEWHRVTLFGRQAEIAAEYLHKGSQVYISGRLHTRKWQADDGSDRYSTEIVGWELGLLGGDRDRDDSRGSQDRGAPPPRDDRRSSAPPPDSRRTPPPTRPSQPDPGVVEDDDIPF